MVSRDDIITYGSSTIIGKNINIRLIDFPLIHPRASNLIKAQYIKFRDQLTKMILTNVAHRREQDQRFTYILEIIWSDIIDDVVEFNNNFPESDGIPMIFICLDNNLLLEQENLLRRRYFESFLFHLYNTSIEELNMMTIYHFHSHQSSEITHYNSIQFEWNFGTFIERLISSRNSSLPFYPLLLHVNSISSGLVFNYYYSYLNRQVGSTNSIFLDLTFNAIISKENLPQTLIIVLHTLIESVFLHKNPSSVMTNHLDLIQSNPLQLNLDVDSYKIIDNWGTHVTFCIHGVSDFGYRVQKVYIWQKNLPLDTLISIRLRDDVRKWNIEYEPCSSGGNDEIDESPLATFHIRIRPNRKCFIFSMTRAPTISDRYGGVSTMKKTSKDSYHRYIIDPANRQSANQQRIKEIRVAPVYYLLAKSSCDCGQANIGGCQENQETFLEGTIRDPVEPNRIKLAYVHNKVLRSPKMIHYNRYLRRTYYYIDVIDENGEIIRYLFCAEYPYIMSILDQLYQMGQISRAQKRDEYVRFCNILQRLIELDPWPESIRLIQFDDDQYRSTNEFNNCLSNAMGYADVKSFWLQITEDIDEYYEPSPTTAASIDINTKIIPNEQNKCIALFFTERAQEDPSIRTLIIDLKEKLQQQNYIVESANTHQKIEQSIFICTGRQNDEDNRQMMRIAQHNIIQRDTMRDVFILVNEAIEQFPCQFIRSVPYLTVDLHHRTPQWNENEIHEVISYLNKMNVLSKDYTYPSENQIELFDQELSIQCTSVGLGCAAAFYFNYAKLITSTNDHQYRLDIIEMELNKEHNQNRMTFIRKWVFILPWTIENSTQLIPSILKLTEEEQRMIGFKLTAWKPIDTNFSHLQLTITVGGVFQRSYSTLMIYQLTCLADGKTIYFPMEIPAALNGLQNQYQCILSHFNFGCFDPVEQARIFREQVFGY
ncbi:unnamed protein product, partial [Rotaria sordida]